MARINIFGEEVPEEGGIYSITGRESVPTSGKLEGMVDSIMEGMLDEDNDPLFDVTDIVEEVTNPTEGTFAGGQPGFGRPVYYAPGMPQGSFEAGKIPYDTEKFELLTSSLHTDDHDLVMEAQRYLKSIGFYDGEIDGLRGKKTEGATNRYLINHGQTHNWKELNDLKESVLDYIGF